MHLLTAAAGDSGNPGHLEAELFAPQRTPARQRSEVVTVQQVERA